MVELRPGMRRGVILLVLLVLASTGCATTSVTPQKVTDVKYLAGTWHGSSICHGCTSPNLRARLVAQEDGSFVTTIENTPNFLGRFGVIDGVLRHGDARGWYGVGALVEQGGAEWLTLYLVDGRLWVELQRRK
jgi:hypothetical protein